MRTPLATTSRPLLLHDQDRLDEFPISVRLHNILRGYEIYLGKPLTAGQLRKTRDAELRARYGMGPVMLQELREVLSCPQLYMAKP
jgi:hypothetical protein